VTHKGQCVVQADILTCPGVCEHKVESCSLLHPDELQCIG